MPRPYVRDRQQNHPVRPSPRVELYRKRKITRADRVTGNVIRIRYANLSFLVYSNTVGDFKMQIKFARCFVTAIALLLLVAPSAQAGDRIPQGLRILVNLDSQTPRALVSYSPTTTAAQLSAISIGLKNAGVSEVLIASINQKEFNHPSAHHLAVAFEKDQAVVLLNDKVPAKLSLAIATSVGKLESVSQVKTKLFELFADKRNDETR